MQRPGSLVIVLEDSFRKLDQFDLVLHQESSLNPPQRLRRVNRHLYLAKKRWKARAAQCTKCYLWICFLLRWSRLSAAGLPFQSVLAILRLYDNNFIIIGFWCLGVLRAHLQTGMNWFTAWFNYALKFNRVLSTEFSQAVSRTEVELKDIFNYVSNQRWH